MRHPIVFGTPLLACLALAPLADAATTYVSPTGSADAACTRDAPCTLTSAASNVKAGDTVILLDGIYHESLLLTKSGTSSGWITFQADECATPIIEGKGIETDTGDAAVDQPTGVGATSKDKASYLRFVGLVSRGWNTGFGNHWVDTDNGESPPSNGNIEYKYCVAEGNGRTGFTHYSASGIHIQNCISAHNGTSAAHSWSSGVTLYATSKGTGTALVEGTVSFENMDAQNHTDGSGFIADEAANNVTFQNNIAFGNGGSCLRLTVSSGTKFINNTCYRNAQDPADTGPDNPGEVYFTYTENSPNPVDKNVSFINNVFISTGTGPGAKAIINQPTSGWTSNVVKDGGTVAFFTSPEGTNPDFSPASSDTTLAGKGTSGAPSTDIGFDPKCLVKKAPIGIGNYKPPTWAKYSVDIDYIKSIGGVAKCFNPKSRSSSDIGAYASGAVTKAGTCTPPATGGATGVGGTSATGDGGTKNSGGAASSAKGGTANSTKGGASSNGGAGGSAKSSDSVATGGTNGGSKASSNAKGSTTSSSTSDVESGGSGESGGAGDAGGATSSGSTKEASKGGANSATSKANSTTKGTSNNGTTAAGGSSAGNDTDAATTTATATGNGEQAASGCGCRVEGQSSGSASLAALGLLGLSLIRIRRRRSV